MSFFDFGFQVSINQQENTSRSEQHWKVSCILESKTQSLNRNLHTIADDTISDMSCQSYGSIGMRYYDDTISEMSCQSYPDVRHYPVADSQGVRAAENDLIPRTDNRAMNNSKKRKHSDSLDSEIYENFTGVSLSDPDRLHSLREISDKWLWRNNHLVDSDSSSSCKTISDDSLRSWSSTKSSLLSDDENGVLGNNRTVRNALNSNVQFPVWLDQELSSTTFNEFSNQSFPFNAYDTMDNESRFDTSEFVLSHGRIVQRSSIQSAKEFH